MEVFPTDSDATDPRRRSNVRLQFYLSGQVVKKIEDVGVIFGHPPGKAAAFLLDGASGCERQAGAMLIERLHARAESALSAPAARLCGSRIEKIVLLQVPLAADVAERIGRIARDQELTRAKVCALLLDRAVEDPLWIVDLVRSRLVEALSKPPSIENKPRRTPSPTNRR